MSVNITSEIDALNDTLSAVFSALSDPTRRAMLARLSQGEASVNELAAPFKMSLPAVSKHIKVLEKAGLMTKTINAQQRPCKIDGGKLKQAVAWIDQFSIKITTKKIASQAINTPVTAKNKSKKQLKLEKPPKKQAKPPKPTKPTVEPQEKTNDNKDNDFQQQIGFDF